MGYDLLQHLKLQVMAGMTLPGGRFFTPTPVFFEALAEHKVAYVDAGCGSGETTTEARAAGLNMRGVDICQRHGQEDHVLHLDAVSFPYSPTVWPVMCRPSHDGWSYMLAERALAQGAHVFYAGFAKNHDNDLGRLKRCIVRRWKNAGRSKEGLVLLSPAKFKPKRDSHH